MTPDVVTRTKRSIMSTKNSLHRAGLLEGQEGYKKNKYEQGKGNNQTMPTKVMLYTRTVEYSIRPSTQNYIYKTEKRSRLRRRLANNCKITFSRGSENYS